MFLRATFLTLCLAACSTAVGCKDNTVNQANNETNNYTTRIDATGGRVEGPNGVTLEIPPGALRESTEISISVMAEPGPAPGDVTLFGSAYELKPHDLQLLVDATVTMPAPPTGARLHEQIGFSDWLDHSGEIVPSDPGTIRFKTSRLARFAVFVRKPGRDFERMMLDASGAMSDAVVSAGSYFWSEYVDDTTKIFSLALEPTATKLTLYSEKFERSELAAVDSDYVYFRRIESGTLGRMKRDGSSPQPTWIADLGMAGFTGGSMLSARGYLYFGSKKVEIATGAVSEHGLGGAVGGPIRSSSTGERCIVSPDGNKARCSWGEVDFVAGTSQMRADTVIPFASNATHWITTASTKRPYLLRLEPHGSDAPTATGLQIEAENFSASAVAANSKHLYLSDCSAVHWIDLAAPTTAHTEERVDTSCIGWMHVDEQYAFMKMGAGFFRLTLDKLRSPM